jgi:multimeric flavodoxin WrbA
MRILALVSSNRKRGNTARIVQMIEAQARTLAQRQGAMLEFETLYLGDMDIRPCRGCRTCFDRGEDRCPLKDDIPFIRAKMDAADGLILASPVYVNDVNGVAKTWIDRLAYLCHRPALAGKCAYLIATVADGPTGHTLQTMNMALHTWGCHIVGQAGYKMGPLLPQDELEGRYQRESARVAGALFQAIAQRQSLRPGFLSLMMFKIQQLAWQQEKPGSLDYAYWQEKGWLDPARAFYIAHRANPLKVALARGVGAVVFRFVT